MARKTSTKKKGEKRVNQSAKNDTNLFRKRHFCRFCFHRPKNLRKHLCLHFEKADVFEKLKDKTISNEEFIKGELNFMQKKEKLLLSNQV